MDSFRQSARLNGTEQKTTISPVGNSLEKLIFEKTDLYIMCKVFKHVKKQLDISSITKYFVSVTR